MYIILFVLFFVNKKVAVATSLGNPMVPFDDTACLSTLLNRQGNTTSPAPFAFLLHRKEYTFLFNKKSSQFSLTTYFHYDILEKCSIAFANSLIVLSASPCSIPSFTQWLKCPSNTTCPTLCIALLTAFI